MNDQPIPNSLMPSAPRRSGGITAILIGVLGLGAVVFGVLAVIGFSQAHTARTTLQSGKTAAAAAARSDQEAKDTALQQTASESPFRTYTAPQEFGSFQINFPKTWSSSIDEEPNSSTQVSLLLNPDFIRRANSTDGLIAAKVTLTQRSYSDTLKPYASQKGITQTPVTVSGIQSVQLTGTFGDKRTTRLVLVPVRDKTISFTNEDKNYSHEFDEILAQAKIIP